MDLIFIDLISLDCVRRIILIEDNHIDKVYCKSLFIDYDNNSKLSTANSVLNSIKYTSLICKSIVPLNPTLVVEQFSNLFYGIWAIKNYDVYKFRVKNTLFYKFYAKAYYTSIIS